MREFKVVSSAPDDTKLPTRKTKGSACYDFYMPTTVVVEPHGFSPIIQTGIKAYMNPDEVLLLHVRSSVGLLKHVTLANGVGIIDCDYVDNLENEGNIGFVLQNNSNVAQTFNKGDRIIQGMFTKFMSIDNDITTGERKGGTGSTGK